MIDTPRAIGALAGTALLSLLAACGSSGGGNSETGLTAALGSVSASGPVAVDVTYGDIARLREVGIVDAAKHVLDERWNRVAGVALTRLGTYAMLLPDSVGLDLYAADRAVSIGTAPNTAVRIDAAIDATAVTKKLTALGAEKRSFAGTSGLSFGADNSIDPASKLSREVHVVNELNQVVVGPDRFAASPNGTALADVLGHGAPLLDAPHLHQIADCLGDVAVAVIDAPTSSQNSAVIAVGVRAPDSLTAPHEEVVCSAPADGKAGAVHSAFARNFRLSAVDDRTGQPLSHYVRAVRIDTPEGTVRAVLTVAAGQMPGYVLAGYYAGGARSWDGS